MPRRVPTDPIGRLAEALRRLPGIGSKSSQRMALNILRTPRGYALELAERIREVAECAMFCSKCQNITTTDPCGTCSDPRRDQTILCVVEQPQDLMAIEKTGVYNGLFHVLHGALSPMEGIGPQDIRAESLISRAKKEEFREIILAMNPNAEGEATAHYLASQLESHGARITRIARGVPMGGDLEYIDEVTLGEALTERKIMGPQKGRNDKLLAKSKKV